MTPVADQTLGVLLAGGRAQRMGGGDKCLMKLAGRPLLGHVVDCLQPQVPALILNANGDARRFRDFGLPVVADADDTFPGPLAGILAGMVWARRHRPTIRFIVTAATDTPFLPHDLVGRLADCLASGKTEAAIAASGGRDQPVFGLFRVDLADPLASFLGRTENHAVKAWLDRHSVGRVDYTPPPGGGIDPFFNINTPDDLAAAEAILRDPDGRGPMR